MRRLRRHPGEGSRIHGIEQTADSRWSGLPYNSAARQLVYAEAGRGVDSVIVDGRVVIKDHKLMTLDEDALRREVADLMRHFISDYDRVVESRKRALPHMLEAHRRVWQADIGMNRFIGRTR